MALLASVILHGFQKPVNAEISLHSDDPHRQIPEGVQFGDRPNLLQQGQQYYANGQISQSITAWQSALEVAEAQSSNTARIQTLNFLTSAYIDAGDLDAATTSNTESVTLIESIQPQTVQTQSLFAQALNSRGMLDLLSGNAEQALITWQQARAIYQQNNDVTGTITVGINQAQAFQSLGQYRKAKTTIEALVDSLDTRDNDLLKVRALKTLGVVLQNLGEPVDSKAVLDKSWELSREIAGDAETAEILFDLGNVAKDLDRFDIAQEYYETAVSLASSPARKLDTRLNQLRLALQLQQFTSARQYIDDIYPLLDALPASRPKSYAVINFAESLLRLNQVEDNGDIDLSAVAEFRQPQPIVELLKVAVNDSVNIQDTEAQAYALHQLGKVYLQFNRLGEAQRLTAQSLDLAQLINADDLVARSASQLAETLSAAGDQEQAIATYEIAFQKLQALRRDLVAVNADVQFEFKENIEPVYRNYVDLLLKDEQPTQAALKQARSVMEALQLAELDDYFRDACLDTHPVSLEDVDSTAAIIYPILLDNRMEIIVSLPDKTLRNYKTRVPLEELEFNFDLFYSSFSPGYPRDRHWRYSQKFYSWLIEPLEAELFEQQIKTLVFIPDRFLKNLPMSALYDGEQYLIEKFGVAISPGLQLFPQGERQQNLNLFVGGLSEARQGFDSLPGVDKEIDIIAQKSNSKVLRNQNFTYDQLIDTINNQSFPVVHLATHGQFSSNPDETFLLAWDQHISLDKFDTLFEKRRLGILEPIELLVMSACQTASGDDRAVLGLSGFALRSGAKSTLGSLWPVSDESTTELMIQFYQQLVEKQSTKAEALRQAQLELLRNSSYTHPYFWSAFILVGNWS
ncbi:TPR repeat-containing protein [[Leptolyngbya] sp. PCC 7376]|nr:TPR repeat-containing protein [[Leptolyngbya] sp. PCC 7376]